MILTERLKQQAYGAAALGDLQWFIDHCSPSLEDPLRLTDDSQFSTEAVRYTTSLLLAYAAEEGQLAVIEWLVTESGQTFNVAAQDSAALRWASESGHLEVVKWLIDVDYTTSTNKLELQAQDYYAVRRAANYKHVEVVKWLINESWKYGQDLIPFTVAENAMLELDSSIEAECPNYLMLHSLHNFGYSAEEAKAIVIDHETKTKSRKLRSANV